jgi:hypothetical protein
MFKKVVACLLVAAPAFAGGVKNLNIMAEEAIVDYFAAKNLEVLAVVDTRFVKKAGTPIITESQVAVADRVNEVEYSYVCKNHFVSGIVSWSVIKTECVEN